MAKPPKAWEQDLPPWVRTETEKVRQTRKPPTPKDMPRAPKPAAKPTTTPVIKEIPRLHVRVELSGAIEFTLEGDQSADLRVLISSGANADDILEHLDPWVSGARVTQEIRILQDPLEGRPGNYYSWAV